MLAAAAARACAPESWHRHEQRWRERHDATPSHRVERAAARPMMISLSTPRRRRALVVSPSRSFGHFTSRCCTRASSTPWSSTPRTWTSSPLPAVPPSPALPAGLVASTKTNSQTSSCCATRRHTLYLYAPPRSVLASASPAPFTHARYRGNLPLHVHRSVMPLGFAPRGRENSAKPLGCAASRHQPEALHGRSHSPLCRRYTPRSRGPRVPAQSPVQARR